MSYRNKTYVCLDYDSDWKHYTLMKAWKESEHIDFNFHNAHELNNLRDGSSEETIKRKLRERMNDTQILIILIGESTKNLYRFVRWEIEKAIELDIPIIVVNINKKKNMDSVLCPAILRNHLAIHIPFGLSIIKYAMDNRPLNYQRLKKEGKAGPYKYDDSVYKKLGI